MSTAPSSQLQGAEPDLHDAKLACPSKQANQAGIACVLLTGKSKFHLIDTAARFTFVPSQLALKCTVKFSCAARSGQYLGCKHTRENAHLLRTAKQIWVCTAGGPSAGREGGSFHSSCSGAAGFCIAQGKAVSVPALPPAALCRDTPILAQT